MSTFILTWNPDAWTEGDAWLDEVAGTASPEEPYEGRWSVGSRRSGIEAGDTALLFRQHRDRGVVAAGHFTFGVYEDEHWDESGRLASYADVAYEHVLSVDERLPIDVLKSAIPGIAWDRLQGSGVRVPDQLEQSLLELWVQHIDGRMAGIYPDDVAPTFFEGALRSVKVNRYERNRQARAACLRHHGTNCTVCGFDFESTYGIKGGAGIHVHHLRELSEIGAGYEVDPIKDLIPVCPNCHAALHSARPALTPAQLRAQLRSRRAGGETV